VDSQKKWILRPVFSSAWSFLRKCLWHLKLPVLRSRIPAQLSRKRVDRRNDRIGRERAVCSHVRSVGGRSWIPWLFSMAARKMRAGAKAAGESGVRLHEAFQSFELLSPRLRSAFPNAPEWRDRQPRPGAEIHELG